MAASENKGLVSAATDVSSAKSAASLPSLNRRARDTWRTLPAHLTLFSSAGFLLWPHLSHSSPPTDYPQKPFPPVLSLTGHTFHSNTTHVCGSQLRSWYPTLPAFEEKFKSKGPNCHFTSKRSDKELHTELSLDPMNQRHLINSLF